MSLHHIIQKLSQLTGHPEIELTSRGNTAIKSALRITPTHKKILIPEEGGWLTYKTIPVELKREHSIVKCSDAVIFLKDLEKKLSTNHYAVLLYQNPAGYFAEQPMKEIYALCQKHHCLVIMDVSGSIGTELCDGRYADIMVCSFGEWKLIDVGKGGFISFKTATLREQINLITPLTDQSILPLINQKIEELPERIQHLKELKAKVTNDLQQYDLLYPDHFGSVVVIAYQTEKEKDALTQYCQQHSLEWTECPRYIRVNRKAISIELKRIHS